MILNYKNIMLQSINVVYLNTKQKQIAMKLLSYSNDYTEIDFQVDGIDYCAEIGVDTNDTYVTVELFKLNIYDVDGTEIQYSNPLFKETQEVIEMLMQELYYEIQVCQAEKM